METSSSDKKQVSGLLARAQAGDERAFRELVQPYRTGLQVHCYRMLGSPLDAEDIVQETLLRAWSALERFEPRASVRTWLYRIATNACLDEIERRPKRPAPVEPFASELLDQAATPTYDPTARYALREGLELALVAAIQLLPARQRAVLILRDVLGWTGPEVAELLESTVASVNSALQRARATIDEALPERAHRAVDAEESELLQRYLAAWHAKDFDELVGLLREDAVLRMPPQPSVVGALPIMRFLRDTASGGDLSAMRLSPTWANGRPALVAQRIGDDGSLRPHGILVMDVADGRVAGFDAFIGARFLPAFDFPATPTRVRSP
jgi:RNA polymerase sigma-70 factor, ECF subfamily